MSDLTREMTRSMTCDECRQIIAVADLTDWGDMDRVAAHCHTCDACAGIVTEVRDSARRVAELLDGIPAGVPSALVARRAAAQAAIERQQRRRRRAVLYPLGGSATLVALVALAAAVRGAYHREVRQFALQCLTAEQAAGLVAPHMGRDAFVSVDPATQGLRVLTVTGSPRAMRAAERVLAQFDNGTTLGPGLACATELPNGVAGGVPGGVVIGVPDVTDADAARLRAELDAMTAAHEAQAVRAEAERALAEQKRAAAEAARAAAAVRP